MARKYIWPYCSSAIVIVCGLLMYYVAARRFGENGFSEYALSRRTISFLQPFLFQGFGLALTRQVAKAETESQEESSYSYLVVTTIILSSIVCCLAVGTWLWSQALSKLFFGSIEYEQSMISLVFFLVGLAVHGIAWAYVRGKMQISFACVLEAMNLGFLPLACFLVGDSPAEAIGLTGWVTASFSLAALAVVVYKDRSPVSNLVKHGENVFSYAIPRIPGAFAMAALLSLPATICAHVADANFAGYVAFSCSLLGMAGSLISPLGVVLLPHSTKLAANGQKQDMRRLVWKVLAFGTCSALIIVAVVELFAGRALGYFLDEVTIESIFVVRVMACSTIPFLIYLSLRSVLDGATAQAINSRNSILALLTLLVFCTGILFSDAGVQLVLVGSLVSMSVLAALTVFDTYRILGRLDVR